MEGLLESGGGLGRSGTSPIDIGEGKWGTKFPSVALLGGIGGILGVTLGRRSTAPPYAFVGLFPAL